MGAGPSSGACTYIHYNLYSTTYPVKKRFVVRCKKRTYTSGLTIYKSVEAAPISRMPDICAYSVLRSGTPILLRKTSLRTTVALSHEGGRAILVVVIRT
jgi:hypothetical protein